MATLSNGPHRYSLLCASSWLLIVAVSCANLHAQDFPVSYRIDAARSKIYVVTHRTGLFSFLGHEHAIMAREWSGDMCYAPGALQQSHATVNVVSAGLVIDTDSARALAGLGKGPSPSQVRGLQTKILDAQHLDAASYPAITLTIRGITSTGPEKLQAQGQLVIRQHSREVSVPISLTTTNDTTHFHGVLSVPQSSFGIRPETIAGVVRVADVVDIHFDLFGVPTRTSCAR